jgi:hypothetical protein
MNMQVNFSGPQLLGLKTLSFAFPKAVNRGMKKGADTLLDWMNEGSSKESRTPPVYYGDLIESSSVFVGSDLAGAGGRAQGAKPGAGTLNADPLTNYNGKSFTITVIYNSSYAAKMHEWMGGWGKYTRARKDAGNKWVEKHLQADKDELMKIIGKSIKRELGM